ncbi:hypothetical protein PVAND_006360 [Polypedilum vanderplanki]|uniref:Lipase n=1 Tax=Polypedilum vanderplanki TaxID=319348 RepID=A0A9J6C4P3_POLVA|nr:hypothetical protein PVAND_006360 [Polypedilum vanderplanki]
MKIILLLVLKIHQEGYPVQNYSVITSDGYVLQLVRITRSKKSQQIKEKTVVFLMHGLLCSSMDWLVLGKEKALPFLLADAGFDVFLGNARGNSHSRKNIHLSPNSKKFWNFSWHEIGTIDIPAMIDFALSLTQQSSLHYIGHSQGTTSFFVSASIREELNMKVRTMHALAPVAFMNHLKSPLLRIMAPMVNKIHRIFDSLGVYEFLPTHDMMVQFGMHACQRESSFREVCANALFLLCGYDSIQFNRTLFSQIAQYTPAGASVDQLVHYAQEINSGKFQMFDYGILKNFVKYHGKSPPSYQLDKISVQIFLYYGDNDWMASVIDVQRLAKKLKKNHQIFLKKFNHLDFIYGNDADKLVYKKVIEIIKEN